MKTDSDKQIIFFDGVCNLCNSFIDFIIKKDKQKKIFYTSLQSDFTKLFFKKQNISIENLDTIYFYSDNRIHKKHKAFFSILYNLSFFYKIFSILYFLPNFFGYRLYDYIAKRRYKWFGKKSTCRVPSEDEKKMFLT